ncbi:MAG: transketolase family protein [bacterium]|nr:transketolase family protein [bacterium]
MTVETKDQVIVKKATRDAFGEAILQLARENKQIVALSANLAESTRLDGLIKELPDQYFEVGVAEQNMAGIAAGLALSGKIPFITSFAAFSPGRNWEQIRVAICYNNANVKIVSTHAGLSVGADGATHQALEDIAITRAIPDLVILSPADYYEAKKAVIAAAEYKGPVYIRLSRQPSPFITDESTRFEIGKCNILKEGKDLTIVAMGLMVNEAMLAADKLEKEGISAEVINCHTIKPLDKQTIISSVKKTGRAITAEEHQIIGGLGSAVSEILSENYPVPIKRIGIHDCFGESGSAGELLSKYGCNCDNIVEAAKTLISNTK